MLYIGCAYIYCTPRSIRRSRVTLKKFDPANNFSSIHGIFWLLYIFKRVTVITLFSIYHHHLFFKNLFSRWATLHPRILSRLSHLFRIRTAEREFSKAINAFRLHTDSFLKCVRRSIVRVFIDMSQCHPKPSRQIPHPDRGDGPHGLVCPKSEDVNAELKTSPVCSTSAVRYSGDRRHARRGITQTSPRWDFRWWYWACGLVCPPCI